MLHIITGNKTHTINTALEDSNSFQAVPFDMTLNTNCDILYKASKINRLNATNDLTIMSYALVKGLQSCPTVVKALKSISTVVKAREGPKIPSNSFCSENCKSPRILSKSYCSETVKALKSHPTVSVVKTVKALESYPKVTVVKALKSCPTVTKVEAQKSYPKVTGVKALEYCPTAVYAVKSCPMAE